MAVCLYSWDMYKYMTVYKISTQFCRIYFYRLYLKKNVVNIFTFLWLVVLDFLKIQIYPKIDENRV